MKRLLAAMFLLNASFSGSAMADSTQYAPMVGSGVGSNPTPAHRLACNEWDRCIQVQGFNSNVGGNALGIVDSSQNWFMQNQPTGPRDGGLQFYRPN